MKLYPKCKIEKDDSEYNKDGTRKDGLDFYCISCRIIMREEQREVRKVSERRYREENKERLQAIHREWSYSASGTYSSLKKNAEKRNLAVEMTREEFIDWWNSQEQRCHYCGIPLKIMLELNWARGKHRLSIDRMDNDIIYKLDNIVLACMKCNAVKADIITYEEMKNIVGPLMKQKWESAINS